MPCLIFFLSLTVFSVYIVQVFHTELSHLPWNDIPDAALTFIAHDPGFCTYRCHRIRIF